MKTDEIAFNLLAEHTCDNCIYRKICSVDKTTCNNWADANIFDYNEFSRENSVYYEKVLKKMNFIRDRMNETLSENCSYKVSINDNIIDIDFL